MNNIHRSKTAEASKAKIHKTAAKKANKAEWKSSEGDEKATLEAEAEKAKAEEQVDEVRQAKEVDKKIEALDESTDAQDDEETDRLKRRYMVRRFWQAARRFWTGHGSVTAW